jgi:hypothetical protein
MAFTLARPGPKERVVAINGSGGAFTPIFFTQLCRRVEIIEDASVNAGVKQGLAYQVANDGSTNGFTNTQSMDGSDEPLVLGEQVPEWAGGGAILGNGADASGGFTIPATRMVNLRSLSATSTSVRIREFS